MAQRIQIFTYITLYVLFTFLYSLNFKGDMTFANLRLCLSSSILPALVGGMVVRRFFKQI